MANKFRSVGLVPASGGRLMTRLSADSVSAADYTRKRDWRRVADVEIRREGSTAFWPNTDLPLGYQNYPQPPDYPALMSGTATGVATSTGLATLVNVLDPYSAQFDNPDGLNQNSLGTNHRFLENTSFTVAGWVLLHNKAEHGIGSYSMASWQGGNNEAWFIGFYYPDDDKWFGAVYTPGGVLQVIYGPSLTVLNNTWHYIAMVHDMTNFKIRLYTDGDETEIVSAGLKSTVGASLEMGARAGLGIFKGRHDEWGLWSRALPKAELDDIYNGGVPIPYDSLSAGNKVDMVSYLDFADSTDGVSPIDGSLYKVNIGKSKHPGGWDWSNSAAYAGGVLYSPYVSQANRATLYP